MADLWSIKYSLVHIISSPELGHVLWKRPFCLVIYTLSCPIPIPVSTLFKKLGTAKNEVYGFLESREK